MKKLLLLLLLSPFGAHAQQMQVETYRLPNGLSIYLHEDKTRPEVLGAVVVNGGTIWDPADATGMAHYLEHMLFKGTTQMGTIDFEQESIHLAKIDSLYEELGKTKIDEQRKAIQLQINEENLAAAEFAVANEFDRLINSIGGKGLNAFTSHDMVMYYNTFPPHQFEKWSEIYAHRFSNPVFRLFQSELETVYEEKNMYMDDPTYKLIESFDRAFYKNHPYGQRDILGEVEDLKNPSLKRMYAYYQTYYVPANMALIISGDIDIEQIKPIIAEKFGQWKGGEKPKREFIAEADFKGKEVIKGRYLPIKAGIAGYRTVPVGHPDEAALTVLNELLSNSSETGLWDKLTLDNKLLAAEMEADIQVEHGRTLLIFVPKIIGQSLKKAENLMLTELEKLKSGDFDEQLLEDIKLNYTKRQQLSLESNFQKTYLLANAFISERPYEEVLQLNEQIQNITKEEVIANANKYFGENRLVLYSRTGFPKKNKLPKPPYTPVIPKGTESEYAKAFKEIPELPLNPSFVDVSEAVQITALKDLVQLYQAPNPVNSIFSFALNIQKGDLLDQNLDYLASMLNSAGTKTKSRDEFKAALARLGSNLSIYSSDTQFTIAMQGLEENLEASVALLQELLEQPVFSEVGKKKYLSGVRFERKIEGKDLDTKSDMISDYLIYGENSPYLTRLSLKEIKALPFEALQESLTQLLATETVVTYVGNTPNKELEALLQRSVASLLTGKVAKGMEERKLATPEKPTVFFVHDKKAIQTQIYFLSESKRKRSPEDQYAINAFNEYFGNSMSGVVFQEIREFRSLAYATYARLNNGSIRGGNAFTIGFVGCQADKSVEAMQVFKEMLQELPKKEERLPEIQKSLVQTAAFSKPYFRSMPQTIYSWQQLGYAGDPNESFFTRYQNIQFEDIEKAYTTYIVGNPLSFSIAGNKKAMDMSAYQAFGEVVEMKLKQIRKK
ncbi:peptidase m16 domain protein [Nitritalea halalkaliphila LW7]|uniref:Peptidase m16 domain protein n=1 Tax=Nitritalea halalkaliphila LW7 TaxID=1189621 RepID=I5BZ41_9BACT|nr:M16 family metallopeptidase [Nitritalea halalkaliphila]EIM74843.1 peptidase m16 domain protein [Nitritalea halalkaliphila LW7]